MPRPDHNFLAFPGQSFFIYMLNSAVYTKLTGYKASRARHFPTYFLYSPVMMHTCSGLFC